MILSLVQRLFARGVRLELATWGTGSGYGGSRFQFWLGDFWEIFGERTGTKPDGGGFALSLAHPKG